MSSSLVVLGRDAEAVMGAEVVASGTAGVVGREGVDEPSLREKRDDQQTLCLVRETRAYSPIISQPSHRLYPRARIDLDAQVPPRQRGRLPSPLILRDPLGALDLLPVREPVALVELARARLLVRLCLATVGFVELGQLELDLGQEGGVVGLAGEIALDKQLGFSLCGVDGTAFLG